MKNEPELTPMENASGLNNLLAVAAAETLNVKPPTPIGQHRTGNQSYSSIAGPCSTTLHSLY